MSRDLYYYLLPTYRVAAGAKMSCVVVAVVVARHSYTAYRWTLVVAAVEVHCDVQRVRRKLDDALTGSIPPWTVEDSWMEEVLKQRKNTLFTCILGAQ